VVDRVSRVVVAAEAEMEADFDFGRLQTVVVPEWDMRVADVVAVDKGVVGAVHKLVVVGDTPNEIHPFEAP